MCFTITHPQEELALPLNGKKNNLQRRDLIDYFGEERLQLPKRVITKVLLELQEARPDWEELHARSFLSAEMKEKYLRILENRSSRLFV